ncbi:MAG: hypothetical protein JSU87_10975 [Gemmatimonadota bacterium]|nr:MAG: hypothetical protein JSU87_10975 [Gemmatimonadota bacterium]
MRNRFSKGLGLALIVAWAASCSDSPTTGPSGLPVSLNEDGQECVTVDFEQFTHADAIASITLFSDVTINFSAQRETSSGPVSANATAYDTDYDAGDGGCTNLLNDTHEDTQIPGSDGLQAGLAGFCAECDGMVMMVPAGNFCSGGDNTAGGTITMTGFSSDYEWEIEAFNAVDPDDAAQNMSLYVGAGNTLVGSTDCANNSACGNGEVVTIATTPHTFADQAMFELLGSGGVDDIQICREIEECVGTIGDFVWNDMNQDGIQDAGEPGLVGWTVNLWDCQGSMVATTVTDANGLYLFSNVPCGCYEVGVDPQAGWTPSPTEQGGDPALDSNPNPDQVDVTDGLDDRTFDWGFYMPDTGLEGCTPGYWKQEQHFDSWVPTGLAPSALFTDPGFTSPGDDALVWQKGSGYPVSTQLDALKANQGDLAALTRHAMAALLNALHPDVDYHFSAAQVIQLYNDALAGSIDVEDTKDDFDFYNNGGYTEDHCPLN